MNRVLDTILMALVVGPGATLVFPSCSDSTQEPELEWSCRAGKGYCYCDGRVPDDGMVVGGSASPVYACGTFSCCLLSPGMGGGENCECKNSSISCEAEAQSRRDTKVVNSCPPPGAKIEGSCAAGGENCRSGYLSQNGLLGCCPGTVCSDVSGIPVCTACTDLGGDCAASPCCGGLECVNGKCELDICAPSDAPCEVDADCCSDICSGVDNTCLL